MHLYDSNFLFPVNLAKEKKPMVANFEADLLLQSIVIGCSQTIGNL